MTALVGGGCGGGSSPSHEPHDPEVEVDAGCAGSCRDAAPRDTAVDRASNVASPDAAGDSAGPDAASVVKDGSSPDASAGADRASDRGTSADAGPVVTQPWPGKNMVATADETNQFAENLSGLTYEAAAAPAPAVLWAVLNGPGTMYRLIPKGNTWTFDTANGWSKGKPLRFPGGGGGDPDSEGLTRADMSQPFAYVSIERDNDGSGSRLSVLRFDTSAAGSTLTATHEWNLTSDLPSVEDNSGLEGITWVPDDFLVANQFLDSKGAVYDPAAYPDHGTGLFVVGLEQGGMLYAYALDHAKSTFKRVASFPSGHSAVMGLEFDPASGGLWTGCDDTCSGAQTVLGIVNGKFVIRRRYARPSTLPNSNNEGIAIAPDSECVNGFKRFFWSDDSRASGHALRVDLIPCGPLF